MRSFLLVLTDTVNLSLPFLFLRVREPQKLYLKSLRFHSLACVLGSGANVRFMVEDCKSLVLLYCGSYLEGTPRLRTMEELRLLVW